jgi:pimeloyl-ACP methyl ester carboxylesterase
MDDLAVMMLSEFVQGGVRRGELLRGNRTLRWVEAGSGHPAVVFDAGVGEPGSLAWAGVLPAVALRTRVIAYDRAGIGASDPASQLTLEGEIADLAALVTEAGDGPCVLVGHSWGGLLAQLVAFDHADLIVGLVLIDPAHEETLAAVSWPLRVAVSAQRNGALLLHSLGLLGRTARRALRPFAARLTGDPRVQGLIRCIFVVLRETDTGPDAPGREPAEHEEFPAHPPATRDLGPARGACCCPQRVQGPTAGHARSVDRTSGRPCQISCPR